MRFSPLQLVAVLTALGVGPLLGCGGKVHANFQLPSSEQVEQLLSGQRVEPVDTGWAASVSAGPSETLTENSVPICPGNDLGRGRGPLPLLITGVSRTGRSQPTDSGGPPRRGGSGEIWPFFVGADRSLSPSQCCGYLTLNDPPSRPTLFALRLFRPPRLV